MMAKNKFLNAKIVHNTKKIHRDEGLAERKK